jgi:hypothetical protein
MVSWGFVGDLCEELLIRLATTPKERLPRDYKTEKNTEVIEIVG